MAPNRDEPEATIILARRQQRGPLVRAIMCSGCLPIIVVILLTIVGPTLMLWIGTWLFGLSGIQQVAASIIIVGSEFAFLFVINLIIMANPTYDEDEGEVQPPPARAPERRPRRRSS